MLSGSEQLLLKAGDEARLNTEEEFRTRWDKSLDTSEEAQFKGRAESLLRQQAEFGILEEAEQRAELRRGRGLQGASQAAVVLNMEARHFFESLGLRLRSGGDGDAQAAMETERETLPAVRFAFRLDGERAFAASAGASDQELLRACLRKRLECDHVHIELKEVAEEGDLSRERCRGEKRPGTERRN